MMRPDELQRRHAMQLIKQSCFCSTPGRMNLSDMIRRIFVDIETLPPDKHASAAMPEEIAACSDEEFRRLALDGDFGRVLTVGVIVEQNDKVIHRGLLGRERQTMMFHLDEARTLRAFWKLLRGFDL